MSQCLLIDILGNVEKLSSLTLSQWDLLVRQSRSANLLGKLYYILIEQNYFDRIPEAVKKHFFSENKYFEAQQSSIEWEVENLKHALRHVDTPVVLLKGAAYIKAKLKAGDGRIFNDIDILVTAQSIEKVEEALKKHGWLSTHLDEYDQKYYRKWMHEIPPLKHYQRKTVLDIHHNILPRTSKNTPDSQKLIDASIPIDETGKLRVLSDVDMFIHSATHLFHEGEFNHGLRDLVDMEQLLSENIRTDFKKDLFDRAEELGLQWPVQYAFVYIDKILNRKLIGDTDLKLKKKLKNKRGLAVIHWVYSSAFMSFHKSCAKAFTPVALWLLYIRGHWLKMPLYLLLPHLFHKAFKKDTVTPL